MQSTVSNESSSPPSVLKFSANLPNAAPTKFLAFLTPDLTASFSTSQAPSLTALCNQQFINLLHFGFSLGVVCCFFLLMQLPDMETFSFDLLQQSQLSYRHQHLCRSFLRTPLLLPLPLVQSPFQIPTWSSTLGIGPDPFAAVSAFLTASFLLLSPFVTVLVQKITLDFSTRNFLDQHQQQYLLFPSACLTPALTAPR